MPTTGEKASTRRPDVPFALISALDYEIVRARTRIAVAERRGQRGQPLVELEQLERDLTRMLAQIRFLYH